MYPLKVLTIGCTDTALADLRHELTNLSIQIEGEFVDASSCLAHILAKKPKDCLFVVHPKSAGDFVQLQRLNESALGQPIIALVDSTYDQSLVIRAMRAGAAQVVSLPLQADDLRAAVVRVAVQFGHPASPSRTIAVLGATEGSGATMISLNLASEIGRLRNTPCIVAENAVSFGRFAHLLNITPHITIADLLSDIDQIDVERVRGALTKVEDNLQALVGSYRVISPAALTAESALKLLDYAKQLAEVVVVDCRYVCESFDFDFLEQVQQLVLVGKPTVPSLANLKVLLESLAQRQCMAQQFVVINQFVPGEPTFSLPRISEILDVPRVFTIAADYASIRVAENTGQTLRSSTPHSRTLADITNLAKALFGIRAKSNNTFGSFLQSLTHLGHASHAK